MALLYLRNASCSGSGGDHSAMEGLGLGLTNAVQRRSEHARLLGRGQSRYIGQVPVGAVCRLQPHLWHTPIEAIELHDFPLSAGQELFMPPNVAGWSEGTAWITDSSLAERTASLQDMTNQWVYDTFEPYDAPETSAVAETVETDGLRVGLIGLDWAWKEVEDDWRETGFALSLYDVGFQGQTYHSLSFFVGLGQGEGEREVYFGIEPEGCGTGCPLSTVLDRVKPETDEDGETYKEFWLDPWETSDGVGKLSASERDFIAALIMAVPAMIDDTRGDATWGYVADEAADEGLDTPTFSDIERTASIIATTFSRSGQLSRAIPKAPELERGISAQGLSLIHI